jgi:hypothetical protein
MALPTTTGMLSWAYQTSVLSNIKPKSSFLKQLMFGGRSENLPTEVAELSYLEGHTEMAPFVEVSAEATSVKGNSTRFANVSTPNIRIKRPMEAYNVFLRRLPGTGVFINSGDVVQAARAAAIAEDMQVMSDMIERREEWMVAQMLTTDTSGYMELSYSSAEKANWKVSIPRSTTMTATYSPLWSTTSTPEVDIHGIKKAMARYQQLIPNVCVMGANASAAFRGNAAVRAVLDNKNISAGALDLTTQFDRSGVIYLGRYCGIEFFEYAAQYTADAAIAGTGVATDYVPTQMAIFLHTSPANEAKFLYGAIPDHGAFEQGSFVGQRFSKAWMENDPSVYIQLVQSRPLPMIRRPGSVFIATVAST